jgi:hypothetical protein
MTVDYEYLTKRHREEIQRADEAESDTAREAHLALAHQYLAEIERIRSNGAELGLAARA